MPTTPTEFTMNADVRAVRPDSADAGADADISAFTSLEIYFDANIKAGEWLIATLTPRPWLLKPERFTGYIRSDGRMWDTKAVSVAPADLTDPGNIGVRMLANGAELNLSTPLSYKVSSNRVVLGNGKKWSVTPYSVAVPSTDVTVELGNLSPVPGTTVVGVQLGNLDQLADVTTIGKALGRAVDAAAARTALGIAGTGAEWESYVNFAAFPVTGNAALEYVAQDTGKLYRWNSGTSAYVQIADKASVGLALVDNTSDVNKPVSTAQQVALDAKQPVLTATAVKTSAYTAAVSDLIPADATSAGFTVTLPSAPADKSRIVVKKIDASANAVTVACGGSDVFNAAAGPTSLSLSLQYQAIQLQYKASGGIWYVISTDVPLGGLDARYASAGAHSLGSLGSTYTLTAGNAAGVAFGTLTANTAITLPSPAAGGQFTLVLIQDGTGGRTPSFTGATVDYPSGSPNWVTTAGAVNVLEFRAWDSSAWHVFPVTSGSADIAGNAATATKLATARNINGVAFDGTADITVADATKQPVLTATAVKTTTYTAAAGELVPADATSAAFTVTLPAAPADKARIVIKKVDSSANAVTVAAGGSDKFNTTTGPTSFTLSLQNQAVQLQYVAATSVWYVISTDVPLTGLDARYQAHDTDLDAFAALTPPDDDFVQRKSGAWVNRSATQVKADLNIGALWAPQDHGLIAWAFDPSLAASQTVIGSGTVVVIAMKIPAATTVTNVHIALGVVGTGLVSGQCFAGLYQGGALLAATADQSANWASGVGLKTIALTSAQAVTAGKAYVAILTNGTTNPQFARSSSVANVASIGLSGSNSRYATADTARTTLPATLGAMTAASVSYWAAVS